MPAHYEAAAATPALRGGRCAAANRQTVLGEQFDGVLAAARTGAEWAWSTIYRTFAPAVLGYVRAQQLSEPEDVTSEVFFQVVRSLGGFQGGEEEFRSWLFVIAHRKVLDDGRRRRRRPCEPAGPEVLESHSDHGNVEDEALNRLSDGYLRKLMEGLTAAQRDVLLLRILGGLTVPEAAQVLGRRAGAVDALQRRALARLRRSIEDQPGPE